MLQLFTHEWTQSLIECTSAEELKLALLINILASKKPVEQLVYDKYEKIKPGFIVIFSYKDFKDFYPDKIKFYKLLLRIIKEGVLTPLENDTYELSGWAYNGDHDQTKPILPIVLEITTP